MAKWIMKTKISGVTLLWPLKSNISNGGRTKVLKYLYVVLQDMFYISYKFHMWKQLLSQDEVVWVSDNRENANSKEEAIFVLKKIHCKQRVHLNLTDFKEL